MSPKNRDYDKRIFRLVSILNKLSTHKDVVSRELADEFNVHIRSIQRDLELLNMAGFPLTSPEKGIYSFTEGFSLKRAMITNEEASLLAFLYDIAKSLGKGFENSFHNILEKVIYRNGETPYYAKVPEGVKIDSKISFVKELEGAIDQSKKVELYYFVQGKQKWLRVHPLKIVFYDGFWYLLCRGDWKNVILKLRLDKISSLKALNSYFTIPKNLKTMLDKSVNAWLTEKRNIRVILKIDKEVAPYFKKKIYFPYQKVKKEEKDGSIIVECLACQNMEVRPTILCWMPHIKVLAPKSLKDEITKAIKEFLK